MKTCLALLTFVVLQTALFGGCADNPSLTQRNEPGQPLTALPTVGFPEKIDQAPQLLEGATPLIPEGITQLRGNTRIEFTIGEAGTTSDIVVLHTNSPSFAESVKTAVSQWRFRPALLAGKPISVRVQEEFGFNQETR